MSNINFNDIQLNEWNNNRLCNPLSKRKIKENGSVYKKIKKLYDEQNKTTAANLCPSLEEDVIVDSYQNYRRNKTDPILLLDLPLNNMNDKDLFKFEYKWNPYTGERLKEKDECGALYFDPNSLIHYFYTNRLNNLWIPDSYENNDYIQGHYGDAVGNSPDFEVVGRGKHIEWYLFRLPIIDCYLMKDHFLQSVTMGPILTDKEIKHIYNLSKRYKNFYKDTFGYKRPNLVKIKELYDIAVNPCDLTELNETLASNNLNLSEYEIQQIKFQINTDAVKSLIHFK